MRTKGKVGRDHEIPCRIVSIMNVCCSQVDYLSVHFLSGERVQIISYCSNENTTNTRETTTTMDDMQVRRRSNRQHGTGPGGDADSGSPVKRAKTKSQSVDREGGHLK